MKVSANNYIIVGRCLLQKFQQKNSCFMMVQAPLLILPNRNYENKDMRTLSIYLYSLIHLIVFRMISIWNFQMFLIKDDKYIY